jgi:AcrR family transcriptional regulator
MSGGEHPVVPRGRHAPPLEVRLDVQRRRLFGAASVVVVRDGYAATTAEAIAREAGMSKATFYEHFSNKEACILSLLDEGTTELMVQIGDAADRGPFASYEERVRRNARAFLRTLAEHPGAARALLVQIGDIGTEVARRHQAALDAFAEGLLRDNARHAPPAGAPVFASRDDAYAVTVGVAALAARRLRDGDGSDLMELEPVIVRLVMGTLERAGTA